jgi:hypothetical protein
MDLMDRLNTARETAFVMWPGLLEVCATRLDAAIASLPLKGAAKQDPPPTLTRLNGFCQCRPGFVSCFVGDLPTKPGPAPNPRNTVRF